MDGQDGQDIRTLCHYIQDGDAMQLSSALAFGARGLVCRRLGGMEWMDWIAHTSHHIHSLACLDAEG
jgi:hypothetical protein